MQKIVIACAIALLVIIGIIFISNNGAPEEAAVGNASSETKAAVREEEPAEETSSSEHENMEELQAPSTEGTDVGMEFPIPEGSEEGTDVSVDKNAKVFTVTGRPFEFSLREIRVKEGDTVTVNFESEEGFHDWVVDEFDAATERVQAGGKTSVTFVADKKGQFEYYCSVGSHRQLGMVGTLIVE